LKSLEKAQYSHNPLLHSSNPKMAEKSCDDSSKFLSLQTVKGKEKFEWQGSLQNLQSFLHVFLTGLGFIDAQESGVWSNPKSMTYKATFTNFVCTWFENTGTLLLQGKKADHIRSELKKIHKNPITFGDYRSSKEKDKTSKKQSDEDTHHGTDKQTDGVVDLVTADQVHDGMVRGKDVKLVIASQLRKWVDEKCSIVVTTPFLDQDGLTFLVNCIPEKTNIQIYVRKVCLWDSNIEHVIKEAKLSNCWIIKHIFAIRSSPSFHAKFLAGVSTDKVEFILTSCNITKDHLESEQLESLERKDLSLEEFNDFWLKPLQGICEGNNTVQFVNMDDLASLMKQASI